VSAAGNGIEEVIRAHCRALKMPTVAQQFRRLAEEATKKRESHLDYLEALLAAELEEREMRVVGKRIRDAKLPRMKTMDEFDFGQSPRIQAKRVMELSDGGYIERTEPVIFLGECGTGKTHLMTALLVAAARQKRRVRFTTAANLVNELAEARNQSQLSRTLARWNKYEVVGIDELGYVPLAESGAEFLFQVISDRVERRALILTTNLPFSEWTQIFPNARLCKAILDRVTDQANIIETGTESYRFRRTKQKRKAGD
jgi:DNA replication protein DnaC